MWYKNLNCMMRKPTLQCECCKSMLTANIFVEWLQNVTKETVIICYIDNVYSGKAGHLASTWKQVPDTNAYKLLSLVTQRIVKEELSNKGHIAGQRSNMMMPYKIYEFCKIFLNSSFSKIQRSSSRKIVL